jgi:glycerol kinase
MHEALAKGGIGARDVAAIGITNQRETTVLWDRATGVPVAPAIVWQDRRTAPLCDALRAAGHAPMIARKTGLVLDAYFSGTKLKWLLDNVPGTRARAAKGELAFGTVDSWLIWNLTRGAAHITDPSNASRTLLFDIRKGDWDDELLALLDIPRSVLPHVVPSSATCGHANLEGVDVPIAGHRGRPASGALRPGLPLAGAREDHVRHRLLPADEYRQERRDLYQQSADDHRVAARRRDRLRARRRRVRRRRCRAMAAGRPQDHQDRRGDRGARIERPGQRGRLPCSGVRRPRRPALGRVCARRDLRPDAGSNLAHIARAALEAIAFQNVDVLAAMQKDAGITLQELRVDGGATANNLLMQIQADVLGVPVVRPKVLETTALGAGYLAGLAVGYWKDAADVAANWRVDRIFEPAMTRDRVLAWTAGWNKAVARAKAWA